MAAPSSYQGPARGTKRPAERVAGCSYRFREGIFPNNCGDILEEKDGALYSVTVSSSLASVIAELNIHEIGNLPVI